MVAAKKDKAIKEAMLDYVKTKQGRVRPFSKGVGVGRVEFNLTIHRFRKTAPKLKNILELYGAFATNVKFRETVKVWSKLPELYKQRWGIETGYRVDGGGFRALTAIVILRFGFFIISMWFFWVMFGCWGIFWGVCVMGWRLLGGVGFGFVWGSFVWILCIWGLFGWWIGVRLGFVL